MRSKRPLALRITLSVVSNIVTISSSHRHLEQPVSAPQPSHQNGVSNGDSVTPSAGVASTHSQLPIVSHDDDESQLPRRVPWLFRTTLVTPPNMPLLPFPKFGRRKDSTPPSAPATAMADMSPCPSGSGSVPGAEAIGGEGRGRGRPSSRDNDGLHASQQQQQQPVRWEQSPTGSLVETRVWSSESSSQRLAAARTAAAGRRQHGAGLDDDVDLVHPGVRVQTDIATQSLRRASIKSPDEEVVDLKRARGWGA